MKDGQTQEGMRRVPRRTPSHTHFIVTDPLRMVWRWSLAAAVYSVLPVFFPGVINLGVSIDAILTFSVSMMLSVRVASTYDRWWEARKHWGTLVNISRNLAIKLREFSDPSEAERLEHHRHIQGFCRGLKNHLRGGHCLQEIRGFVSERATPEHVPGHIAGRIYRDIERLRRAGRLTETQVLVIDTEAHMLLEVCGACERIRNTLMSPSFPAFIRFAILLFVLALPWDLADTLGWWTLPVMILGTFLMAGAEAVAYANERPFGTGSDDLDLEAYCDGIDRTTAEILDVPSLVR